MRGRSVIIGAALVLVATATLLLRSSPLPVLDRNLPTGEANPVVTDSLESRDSSIAKTGAEETSMDPSAATDEASASVSTAVKRALGGLAARALEPGEDKAYLQAAPLSKDEVKSVKKLFETFFASPRGKDNLNKLIRQLRLNGLDPEMARDFNPYTGKMLTIRTNEALEGTRYFHAQFFQDDETGKDPVRQHLSFEIRPSPDCMKVGQEIVEAKLGKKLGTPTSQRGDEWIEWKKDGESIWLQRLGRNDLNADRLNARTIADIGTCRAAIEQIPAEHAEESDTHVH